MPDININEAISYAGAERAVLTLCLRDNNKIIECEELGLKSEYFSVIGHKYIYSVIAYLYSNPDIKKIDSLVILNTLPDENTKKAVDELGGMEYLDLLFQADIADNIKVYVEKIKEAYVKRLVWLKSKSFMNTALTDEKISATDLLNRMQEEILQTMLALNTNIDIYKMGNDLDKRLEERMNNPTEVSGYRVGWTKFDKYTQGYIPGELTIFCAPSKTGKSALLLNHAKALSVDCLIPTLYIDTEMPSAMQEDRLLANISGVDFTEIRNGQFTKDTVNGLALDKMRRIKEAKSMMKEAPFYHVYMPDFDIDKVSSFAKKMQLQYDIQVLIFDYIKLPTSEVKSLQNAQEYQKLGFFTTCLHDLAGTLKIPVITAAQTNISGETETNPSAKNIGGSYRILQMADKLFFLRNKTDEELALHGLDDGNMVLSLAYQRSGSSENPPINIYSAKNLIRMEEA